MDALSVLPRISSVGFALQRLVGSVDIALGRPFRVADVWRGARVFGILARIN